jgi:DNA sulfur modification protein DndD
VIIERVRLLNFGPFFKEHELVFPGNGEGVHIVRGDNGQGKTSINRAILWGLYGSVSDRKGQAIRPTSLLNHRAARDDLYQFGVTIHFSHDGEKWTITRRMEARSHSDRMYNEGMQVHIVKDGVPLPNAEQAIQRIIPEDVSRFFFFDGEMLRDYEELLDQSNHSMVLLRDSIEHVLGIPYLKVARDDLSEIQRKLEGERARLVRRFGGASYDAIVDDFQAITTEIDGRAAEIKNLERQMAALEMDIAENKRKQVDLAAVRDTAEKRNHLEKQIESLEGNKQREEDHLRSLLAELYKTVLVRSAEDIIAQLQAKHELTMAKYNQKQQLVGQEIQLRKAIDAQKCKMCGTVLNPSMLRALREEHADTLVKIKQLTEVPEPNLEYEDYANRLKQVRSQAVRADTLKGIESQIFDLEHELQSLRAQQSDLSDKLKGVDAEEPRRLELEISRQTQEKGRLDGLKEGLEAAQLIDLETKAELDQRISSIDKVELNTLGDRIDFIAPITDLFEKAISAYRDETREHVGSIASGIFSEIRSKAYFERLQIDPQFGLSIITTRGTVLNRAEWRSAGEEQVVALALVGALNRCAQIRAPVFMDTPFGRLDTTHSKRILRYLPKLADQIVVFVTDREFSRADEAVLAGYIKSDHTLVNSGEEEGAHIELTGK